MLLFYTVCGELNMTTAAEAAVVMNITGGPVSFTITGTTAIGTGITATSDLTGVAIGATIHGTAIPEVPPTTIVTADNTLRQLTLSQAATGVHVGETLTIDSPYPGIYANATVMLYVNPTTIPARTPTVVSLGEATFDGYARSSAIEWGSILYNAAGQPFITGDKKQFVATGSTTPNTILGAALVAEDGTTILQVSPFLSPVSISLTGQGVDVVPVMSMVPQT